MDFLSNLHTDVKLLLVAAALALFAALLSGSKKKEHRYMAVFTLMMVAAGYRIHQQGEPEGGQKASRGETTTVVQGRKAGTKASAH